MLNEIHRALVTAGFAIEGVSKTAGTISATATDPAQQVALNEALPGVIVQVEAQLAAVEAAQSAAAVALSSAKNMMPFAGYFGALQKATRKSIVDRDVAKAHWEKLVVLLDDDEKMWGDFKQAVLIWQGIDVDNLTEPIPYEALNFAAAIFVAAGTMSALLPLMANNK